MKADERGSLLKNLKSRDAAVRKEAAVALGSMRDPRTVEPLIRALATDKDWAVRWAVEESLVKIGNPAVRPLKALLDDKDWRIRRRVTRVLAEIRDPDSVELLIRILKNDRDCCVRKFAARGLGEAKHLRAAETLLASLENRMLDVIAGAYRFFIRKGDTGTEEILIEALNKNYNKSMAADYLNCGNLRLREAAHDCAKLHGYSLTPTPDWKGPRWGESI